MEYKLKCNTYKGATKLALLMRETTTYAAHVLNPSFNEYYVLVHTNDKEL